MACQLCRRLAAPAKCYVIGILSIRRGVSTLDSRTRSHTVTITQAAWLYIPMYLPSAHVRLLPCVLCPVSALSLSTCYIPLPARHSLPNAEGSNQSEARKQSEEVLSSFARLDVHSSRPEDGESSVNYTHTYIRQQCC